MIVGRTFTFDAAHSLPGHPKCGVKHGHTWRVDVGVTGHKDLETGMVIDFHLLKSVVESILDSLDHKDLNTIISMPTVENIAAYIALLVSKHPQMLYKMSNVIVTVQEGDGGYATVQL